MNLVLGYNGFARVLGRNHMGFGPPDQVVGSAAGAQLNLGRHGGFGGFGSQSQGWSRLFAGEFGFEIGWLVPAALLATVLVVLSRGRAPRTDLTRAAAILFGGWLVVDGLVLSLMHGMVHAYYCMSIAPPVAAMFAIGLHELWRRREKWLYRGGLAVLVGGTGVWSWWVLGRNAQWVPGLRWTILVLAVVAVLALLGPWTAGTRRAVALGALGVGLVGALAGPAAYAIVTIGQPHQGGGPSVGPADASRQGDFGFGQIPDNRRPRRDSEGYEHRMVRRDQPLIERGGPRIVHGHSCHGDRRVLGQRSGADAEPISGRRGAAQGGLLRRREQPWPRTRLGATAVTPTLRSGSRPPSRRRTLGMPPYTTCRRRSSLTEFGTMVVIGRGGNCSPGAEFGATLNYRTSRRNNTDAMAMPATAATTSTAMSRMPLVGEPISSPRSALTS